MTRLGYALSSEEHSPNDLVRQRPAGRRGGLLVRPHLGPLPPVDRPDRATAPSSGRSWARIAHATERLEIGTGVTCPTVRTHPAIIAQAAATVGAMMPGRFFLGVGTGEALNEHILGDKWPEWEVRAEMLEEAVEVIRLLWKGKQTSHYGDFYTVENARIYDLPDPLPPIHVAASGPRAGSLAGRIGDGFIGTSPEREILAAFDKAGGSRKPKFGQIDGLLGTHGQGPVADRPRALADRRHPWRGDPGAAGAGPLRAARRDGDRGRDQGGDRRAARRPGRIVEKIRAYADAGYDNVYLHQVGPDQSGFLRFAERELLPAFASTSRSSSSRSSSPRKVAAAS